MKKIIYALTVLAFMAISSTSFAQENVAKLNFAGANVQTGGGGTSAGYQFTVGYERVFGSNISGQLDLGFITQSVGAGGFVAATFTSFYMKPAFKYYLLDDAPHGLNIGAYVPFAIRTGLFSTGVGPQVGYQMFFLDDRLAAAADLGMGLGVGIASGGGGANVGFNMTFSLGAGYAF